MTGTEQVLIEDWCQQYPSHSVGDLAFGADGALYVSGGEGASFNFADYGQDGRPAQPLRRSARRGRGDADAANRRRRGARVRRTCAPSGDPVTLDGAILRVDPATGAALPDNPLIGNADANARRIIAYGLRNPFRFTIRPGTSEVWLGDVGWSKWEEINRIANPTDSTVETSAGRATRAPEAQSRLRRRQPQHLREPLRAGRMPSPHPTTPTITPQEWSCETTACTTGSSSISGMAFYKGGPYPDEYDGALFFADYSRKLHLGDGEGHQRFAGPSANAAPSWLARRIRSTWRSARAGISSTSTSTAGRSAASSTPLPTSPPLRARRPTLPAAPRPLR